MSNWSCSCPCELSQDHELWKMQLLFAVVVPYYLAQGNYSIAENAATNPGLINVTTLVKQTETYATSGMIDPTRNMLNDRVFIYHGMNDTRIYPGHTPLFYLYLCDAYHPICRIFCRKQYRPIICTIGCFYYSCIFQQLVRCFQALCCSINLIWFYFIMIKCREIGWRPTD